MQRFLISDSFYNKEYVTPHESIFNLYNIGTWEIGVRRKHVEVSAIEVILHLNELMRYFPWLVITKFGIRTESAAWTMKSSESLTDYFINLVKNKNQDTSIEFDLADIECSIRLQYKEDTLFLKSERSANIYCFFDSEYQRMSFNLYLNIDLFTANPSRQPDVYLSENEIIFNRELLASSLESIDKSGVFEISNFSSDFFPELISKYGFTNH